MMTTRRFALWFAVGLGLSVNGFAQSFLTNGLIAYYPFNGNGNDASGHGRNATNHGAVLTADRFGNPNSAYLFGDTPAYLTAPLSSTLFSNDFTASVWVNVADYNNSWPTVFDEAGNTSFRLGIVGETSVANPIGSMYAYATPGYPAMGWSVQQAQPFPTHTFLHVVLTKAGSTVSMYWNGQSVATTQVVSPVTPAGNLLYIGIEELHATDDRWVFHGVIDDVRFYSRALASQEVAQLYALESGPSVDFVKIVKPCFSHLWVGTNYQLQVSSNLETWTNYGDPFTATNSTMIYPQYFEVENWRDLFFRLR
jgi:hypothetical protein